MASPTSAFSICCPSSYARTTNPTMYSLSFPSQSCLKLKKALNFALSSRFSQMGLSHLSPWSGLKHVGVSLPAKPLKLGSRERCRKGMVVHASLFGVGAPELLVIGAVALMVFGPKGLAEVAKSLGKTLREFQPTIKELQEVSREFKSTLEREIGLDDDPNPVKKTNESSSPSSSSNQPVSRFDESQLVPVAETNGAPPSNAYPSELNANATEDQTNAASEQDTTSPPSESQIAIEGQSQDDVVTDTANSAENELIITEEQPTVAVATQHNGSVTDNANSSEDGSNVTEEQPTETLVVQQDGDVSINEMSSENGLNIIEEQPIAIVAAQEDVSSSPEESLVEAVGQSQGVNAVHESATAAAAVQMPESES